jgi:hypothetical protein
LAALPGYRHLRALSRRRTPDASLKRLERSRSCRHLWFSYPFNERTGPRHATYSSPFTSKPLRPRKYNYKHYSGFRKPSRQRQAVTRSRVRQAPAPGRPIVSCFVNCMVLICRGFTAIADKSPFLKGGFRAAVSGLVFVKRGCWLYIVQQFINSLTHFLLREDHFPLYLTLSPRSGGRGSGRGGRYMKLAYL